jgi:hypothetical protein
MMQRVRLLLHGVVLLLRLVLIAAVLALADIDRVERDVMVCAHVRVADRVELELVRALRERELELDRERLRDSDALDREQLPRRGLADDEPPVRELLLRVERRDDRLVRLLVLLVRVPAERDLERDRLAGLVVALDKLVCDVKRRVRVDKGGDVPPGAKLVLM